MLELNSDGKWPQAFSWRGIRFEQESPQKGELVRYRSATGLMYGIGLAQYDSGQWTAKYLQGSYAIEWDWEDALITATHKAIGMMEYEIGVCSSILNCHFGLK